MCAHISAEFCTCSLWDCIVESKFVSSSHHLNIILFSLSFFYFLLNAFLTTPSLYTQNVTTEESSLVSVCPTSKSLEDKHRKLIKSIIVRGINVSTLRTGLLLSVLSLSCVLEKSMVQSASTG